ncbi:MAG TPA: hypothetical protein PLU10_09920, partial [Chitinophagaceae bacterium]|nr:hypothetical protein [Chitinophagaceae bacterium]
MKNLQISTNKSGSLLLKLFAGLLLFSHFNLKAQLQAGTIPLNSFLDTASFNHTVEWLNASSYSVQLNLDEDPQSEIGFVISAYLSSLNGPTQYVELSNFDPSISIAFSNSGSDNFTNFIDYGENIDNTLNYSNNGMYVAAATNMIYGGETSATDTFRYIPFRQLIGSNFYRYGWIRLSIAEIAFGYKVLGISWTHFSPSIPL